MPKNKRQARAKQYSSKTVLHALAADMRALDAQHSKRLADGDNPSDVDRDIAEAGLARIVDFFLDHGIESQPIHRLFCELAALSAGASPSRMLLPAKTRHRRPDSPAIENIKGRLAAIMEYRQRAGLTRRAAADWVVRNTPAEMKRRLGMTSAATVSSWLLKWGGKRGAVTGHGRDGFLATVPILQNRKPDEQQLKSIIAKGLRKSLPS